MDWHNIPKPERKGLQYKDMTEPQRAACMALIKASLSETGYDKAQKIMSLEANLREGEKNLKNGQLRDPHRYFFNNLWHAERQRRVGLQLRRSSLLAKLCHQQQSRHRQHAEFLGANPATVHIFVEGGLPRDAHARRRRTTRI